MKKIICVLVVLGIAGLIIFQASSRRIDGAIMTLDPMKQSFTVIQKRLLSGRSDTSEIYVIPTTRFQGIKAMMELKMGDRVKVYVVKKSDGRLEAALIQLKQKPITNI